ncbi:MAG TPA: DUF3293 domain-containing protein [Usitatibacter sp.]|nr:DUF3293 domain-containing protein [Usitatibacter sp.]
MPSESLLQQYLASLYRIRNADEEIVLHVGVRSPELAALQRSRGVRSSAFVTAWNPGSRPLDRAENEARDEALRREAAAGGYETLDAQGHSPDRDWYEKSCLLLGIDRAAALALARRYGQVAFLFMGEAAVPELVICEDEPG